MIEHADIPIKLLYINKCDLMDSDEAMVDLINQSAMRFDDIHI